MLTERAAAAFAELARSPRAAGRDPRAVAHFVNRLVFRMFAEDVGLLPDDMFTRMLEHARRRPEAFEGMASALFGAMADGGLVGFEPVDRFDGGLFDDASALPLDRAQIESALAAAALDWSEIDPSILGTLFERGLNPAKRAQLGAHYTDRRTFGSILLILLCIFSRSAVRGATPPRFCPRPQLDMGGKTWRGFASRNAGSMRSGRANPFTMCAIATSRASGSGSRLRAPKAGSCTSSRTGVRFVSRLTRIPVMLDTSMIAGP